MDYYVRAVAVIEKSRVLITEPFFYYRLQKVHLKFVFISAPLNRGQGTIKELCR